MEKAASVLYTSPSGFNYSLILPIETDYLKNQNQVKSWMTNHWAYSFPISAIYLILIYVGKNYMASRNAFELRRLFLLWNICLATYSILGASRTLPEFIYILSQKGIKYSICVETFSHGITGYWSWLFILSKPIELVDTAFLILRKRELIFLHWYHHVTVLIFVWYSMIDFPATGRWFATINYTIHAIMYAYYAIAVLRIIHIPKWISMAITSMQIIQMVAGVYVNIKAYYYKQVDNSCDVNYSNIYASLLMYASYFYLFFKFFYDKYFCDTTKKVKNIHEANGKKRE